MRKFRRSRAARSAAAITVIAAAALGTYATIGGAATTAAPLNTDPPTVTGTPKEGETLAGQRGTWTGTVTDYDDAWLRCNKNGSSCAPISGANNRLGYKLTGADAGNTIRFKVFAKNGDQTTVAESVPTSVIAALDVTPPAPSTPATGCAKTGAPNAVAGITSPARLTIDQTEIVPSAITFGTRTFTARFHVTACGGPVEGALVYITAVPYRQFAIPSEQPTDKDGWATLRFQAQAGWPTTQKQQLLVMFARARKSGENLLGGISTRRLVSFRVTSG